MEPYGCRMMEISVVVLLKITRWLPLIFLLQEWTSRIDL